MSTAKRALFVSPSPRKRAKTTAQLTKDVTKLARQVNANKPEIRQQSYTITIPASPTGAVPLLDPNTIIGDEYRLHRIFVSLPEANAPNTTDAGLWGMLYSPNEGYTPTNCLPDETSVFSDLNLFYPVNRTKCRQWVMRQYGLLPNADGAAGTNRRNMPLELDKKFSIPMKCGTAEASQADPTTVHNQVYLSSSITNSSEAGTTTIYVTVWFTDN